MDDPALAWPAWKFGMKRDAIHTTLHDLYNTFSSTIQDPDAFHHDVREIASEATSVAEFHHLLGQRRQLRLKELNDSLESASYEIIASPMLIGTKQWEHALQLFRTRSLDSLVRYFSSYLPSDHHWYQPAHQLTDDANEKENDDNLPPSPRSITTYADDFDSVKSLNTMSSYTDSESDVDEPAQDIGTSIKGKPVTKEADVNSTQHPESPTDASSDDGSSQSSGPETPDSMSDAEPDVADDDHHQDTFRAAHPILNTSLKVTENTVAASVDTQSTTTPTRRPLPSGCAVDADRCSASMPLSHSLSHSHSHTHALSLSSYSHLVPASASACVRARQRSMSPSRPSPREHSQGIGRRMRPGSSVATGKVEKTKTPALPRPMRTRLRERREAAAAAVRRD